MTSNRFILLDAVQEGKHFKKENLFFFIYKILAQTLAGSSKKIFRGWNNDNKRERMRGVAIQARTSKEIRSRQPVTYFFFPFLRRLTV